MWAACLVGTVVLGAQAGLTISIALALLFVIYESATPNVVQLGRLPGTRVYRCLTIQSHTSDTRVDIVSLFVLLAVVSLSGRNRRVSEMCTLNDSTVSQA